LIYGGAGTDSGTVTIFVVTGDVDGELEDEGTGGRGLSSSESFADESFAEEADAVGSVGAELVEVEGLGAAALATETAAASADGVLGEVSGDADAPAIDVKGS
jgi:hypothetical protein